MILQALKHHMHNYLTRATYIDRHCMQALVFLAFQAHSHKIVIEMKQSGLCETRNLQRLVFSMHEASFHTTDM